MQSKDAVLTMQIQQKLLDDVGVYATSHNLSRSACIRMAIAAYIGETNYKDTISIEERATRRAKKQREYNRTYRARHAAPA